MPDTVTNWHHHPLAQRLLAKLHVGNVERRDHVGIPADFWTYAGTDRFASEAILALEYFREASIDEAVGYAFADVSQHHNWDHDKAHAWNRASMAAPSVTQAIAEAFASRVRGIAA